MNDRMRLLDAKGVFIREVRGLFFAPFPEWRVEDDGAFKYIGVTDGIVIYRREA